MVTIVGWDIGGANTKAVFIRIENGYVKQIKTAVQYFPIWKDPEKLSNVLLRLKERVSSKARVDAVGLTMTAELSDAYQTKREGVAHILSCAQEVFAGLPVFVLDVDSSLRSIEAAKSEPLRVAAANWVATGWMVAQGIKTCVIVDVGSTSTSIIPVIDGHVSAVGKTDLEKLMFGELVYSGSLRTNVATIVDSVPLRGGTVRVSSEMFAQSGDIHLILGNIGEGEYATETADGRGKTRRESLARLARVVCADIEMLTEEEIVQIAKYVHGEQVKQVAGGLSQVYSRIKSLTPKKVPVVVTGIGKKFIARVAGQKIGVDEIIGLEKVCFGDAFVYQTPIIPSSQRDLAKASPAVGVALMVASKLEGRKVKWTSSQK
ncbi:MAG: H4MPT-linked C1 transfer pathway protein [Candidatus Bathyarchaeota archaeon]|nr:H4MPT-linked C1 transfer pathway protein [Candidatus Bathyarchaeota archaeon]